MANPIRQYTAYRASGTASITATYAEGTALDSTHLHVAVVQVASTTGLSTPSGWTMLDGNGNNGSNQVRAYVRQGDGSVNSFSITPASGSATVVLMAFEGFITLTPFYSGGNDGGAATSVGVGFIDSPGDYGVALSAIGVSGSVTWGSVTNGTRVGATTGSSSVANANQRLSVATSEYAGEAFDITQQWTTSRTQRYMPILIPLVDLRAPPEVPEIVGVATGGIVDNGTFDITPPAGAAGYIAVLSLGHATPTTITEPVAPEGFVLYQTGNNSYTAWRIYVGHPGAGSTWTTTNGWSTSAMVIGLTAFEIEAYGNGGPQNTNPTPDQTAPSVTTATPSLVTRLMTAAPWPGAPSGSYPAEAPNNRHQVLRQNDDESSFVALATSNQTAAGATGTAAFNFTPLDGSTVHTLALKTSNRTITYTDTPWDTVGTSTSGDGDTRYKDIVIPGAQIGDLILVFGVAENYQGTTSERYMNDVSVGGVKTGPWIYNAPHVNSNTDVDFYAGYALVTSSGDITIRVGLRINVSTGKVGVGAYLIPSTLLTSSYGFADSGFTNDTDSQIPTTLSSNSKVIYMAGDWATMGLGSIPTPAGGTIHRTFYDSSYGVWTALWDNQPVGTRNYGASGVSGHDISGAIFILSGIAAAPSGWFLGTGAQLLPYTLTGIGLVPLFDTLPPTTTDLPNIVGTASGGRQGGDGTFSVTPPAGSVGKIAIAQFAEASNTTVTPPSGWSLVSSGNSSSNGSDNWSRYAIFIGDESATGTTWTLSNAGSSFAGCALVMSGYDSVIAINAYDLLSTGSNPDTLNSPSVSTSQTSLILRALTEQYDTAPTATVYPVDATLGRDRYYIAGASGEAYGHHVAIAHSTQTEPGSTGAATWTMPNSSWHPSAMTIAIIKA